MVDKADNNRQTSLNNNLQKENQIKNKLFIENVWEQNRIRYMKNFSSESENKDKDHGGYQYGINI